MTMREDAPGAKKGRRKMAGLIEALEDAVLGAIAREREKQASRRDYLTHARMKKLVGLLR